MTHAPMEPNGRHAKARRDLVAVAALLFVAVGIVLTAVPFFRQMNPNPGTPAPEITDVDIADIVAGQHRVVAWRGLPVIVKRRTQREMAATRNVFVDGLRDPTARNDALPATARADTAGRTLAGHPEWLVVIGVNPRSGCKLNVLDEASRSNDETFVCPCDGSRFDELGRVRSGPASTNLRVPPAKLVSTTRLRIG